ncbi:MFS transporter [Roseiarcus fermentans]|uniref:MFS transporter n=1 Tax=Roseiarcus fermentans TaxID=1473586 RepID=UPI001FE12C33|nr:MFS transporter [Roseiarcus fermentans]
MTVPLALDAVNFLSADVRNLFGPFINVFLVTSRRWTQTEVGFVTTASALVGIALQTPIGAAIDVTRAKREVIVATMAAMSAAAAIIVLRPTFWPMAFATTILALAGDAFVPAVAALTLGLVPKDAFARRLGRNSAFDHGGNIATALVAGLVGYAFSQRAVFLLVPVYAALTSAAVLAIPAKAIDHDRARDLGGDGDGAERASALLRSRPLVVFAACAFVFHFANAPLLPLVGQKLALQFPKEATAMLSFCMVAAQAVMVPIALVVGWRADRWGRRPIFLVAFFVLPVRAALYLVSDNAVWLLGVQLLDGVGAGIYQALTPLVIADIMRGTGRYALAQGAVATTQGVGAAISGLAVGEVVDRFGYSTAFLALAAAAAVAFAIFALFMPETRGDGAGAGDPPNEAGR